ncbi:MAG TPA: phosphatase PAP2 family protein [Gemmatimonadales bacterium]
MSGTSWATWRRGVVQRFTAVDLVTLLYVAVATAAVLAFSDDDHAGWDWLLTAHALLVALVLVAPAAREAGAVGRFVGDWYPMVLLGALYAEVGILNVDLGYQHDFVIQRLELWVFGSQLSYRWIREMPNPLLSWALHGCYLAYYAILYASPLGLWFTGRRDAARRTIFAVMVTFYLCYVMFLFFPVAGPRYTFDLAHNAATEVWPARAAQWLLDRGDSWGAAFPSSHVAAAVVAALCALRFWRPLGLVLMLPTIGLVLSVVYGQFHYAVDAVAGLLVALAVFASQYIYASQPAAAGAALPQRELETGRA